MLWIDAICIDQRKEKHSTKERNSQVQMMGEIFNEARRVLVWLGTGDESTPWAFRLLRALGWLASDPTERLAFDQLATKPIAQRLVNHLYGTILLCFYTMCMLT
jgi:hypothetical protein